MEPGKPILRLILGAVGITLLWMVEPVPSRDDPLADFWTARGSRPFEGQPSRPLPFLPYSRDEGTRPATKQLESRLAYDKTISRPRLDLIRGRTKNAVEGLETMVQSSPNDPDLQNDFAIALLAEAGSARPLDYLRALEAAHRARYLRPSSPKFAFNYALSLEKIGLRHLAIEAWRYYLALDRQPGWQEEAGSRKMLLEKALSSRKEWTLVLGRLQAQEQLADLDFTLLESKFPLELRTFAEEELLARWAESVLSNEDDRALRELDFFRQITEQIRRNRSDEFLPEILERLLRARGEEQRLLARALQVFGRGMKHYRAQAYRDAETELRQAESRFKELGIPLVHSAAFYRAVCVYFRDVRAATKEFGGQKNGIDAIRYPLAAAQAHWMLGTCLSVQDRLSGAEREYLEVGPLLDRGLGPQQAAMADVLLAGVYEKRGAVEDAWRSRLNGLRHLGRGTDARRTHSILLDGAVWLDARSKPLLASLFLQEARRNLAETDLPFAEAEIALLTSQMHLQLGRVQAARSAAEQAIQAAARIAPGGLRERTLSWAQLVGAVTLASENPAETIERLNSAHGELEAGGWLAQELRYRTLLAEQLLSDRQLNGARKVLEESVRIYEQRRADVERKLKKAMISKEARKTYHKLLALEIGSSGSDGSSFEIAERAKLTGVFENRSRIAADRFAKQLARVPKAFTFISYTVLEEQVFGWIVESGRAPLRRRLLASTAELRRWTRELETAVKRDDAEKVRALGSRLHEILLAPFGWPGVTPGHLFIIPDSFLARLPYSALFNESTGKFLIEEASWSISPSMSTAMRLATEAAGKSKGRNSPLRALVIGPPDLEKTPNQGLAKLDGALTEALAVGALYRRPRILLGSDAMRNRVLEEILRAEILHFAGHSLRNGTRMEDNCLPLSADPAGARTEVCVSDLVELEVDTLDTVVLGACASLGGFDPDDAQDHFRLAQGFLAAGTQRVIAPLWDIEDRQSVRLLTNIHVRLSEGVPAAAAFRTAVTKELAHDRRRSSHWAAFVLLGY